MRGKEINLTDKDIQRFWSHVDIRNKDECWNWTASCGPRGVGQFIIRRRPFFYERYLAPRVAFVIANNRQIKKGYEIAHKPIVCHNPTCCNPNHLDEKTHIENGKDKIIDGTMNIGEVNGQSKLTPSDIIDIFMWKANGMRVFDIAKKKKISYEYTYRILRRETWAHVKIPLDSEIGDN